LEKLALCFKLKDYFSLKEHSEEFLKKYPSSWIAMTYLAIGEFWTGFDDFKHIGRVNELLNKATDISNRSEFVLDAINRIANNSLVIATRNDFYGNGLITSIKIFNTFLSKDDIKNENLLLVKDYAMKAFEKYKTDLENLYQKTSSTYDPPIIAVNNLYDLSIIADEKELLQFFYVQATHHINQNQTKSYIKDLTNKKDAMVDLLKSKNIDIPKIKLKKYTSSGCFIATATLGSIDHPIVVDFQCFRDRVLLPNPIGKIFINIYYRFSPYLSELIKKYGFLQFLSLIFIIKPLHIIIKKGEKNGN